MFTLLLLHSAIGHPEHYDQCQAAANFHLTAAANVVFFKTERFVEAAVDTLNRTAFLIHRFPLVTAACKRRKDSAIAVDVDSDTMTVRAIALDGTVLDTITLTPRPQYSGTATGPEHLAAQLSKEIVINAQAEGPVLPLHLFSHSF